jgi:hypothetical protein
MPVNEYITKFTQLSRYTPHEVDTDEKKQECFLNGMNDGWPMLWRSEILRTSMVNKVLVLEDRSSVVPQPHDSSAVVLFDYEALHSFISVAYVGKHNLPLALLRCQMIVSSPGRDMPTRQLCPKVNLKIRGVDFVANLSVLESKGIDVSPGMD